MKKTISILLTFVLLCSTLCIGASAQTEAFVQSGVYYGGNFSVSQDSAHGTPYEMYRLCSEIPNPLGTPADADTPYIQYEQFPYYFDVSRDIYNAFMAAQRPQETVIATLTKPLQLSVSVDEEGTIYISESDAKWYYRDISAALSALLADRPEMFWIGETEVDFIYDLMPNSNNIYTMSITAFQFRCLLPAGFSDWTQVKTTYDTMLRVAQSVVDGIEGETRFERVKYLHDWVCRNARQDNTDAPVSALPTSVFFAPHTATRSGYARAFKILCDLAKIPCLLVIGEIGEWNSIRMDDGVWYDADIFMDDSAPEDIYYDYFLVGSISKNYYFDQTHFGSIHRRTGLYFPGMYFNLPYPSNSGDSYMTVMLAKNSQASLEKTTNRIYLPKDVALEDAILPLVGYTMQVREDGKEVQVTIPGNAVPVVYSIIRVGGDGGIGDVNLDGRVTSTDARWILQVASGTRVLTEEQAANVDLNGDGRVNAVDARWALQVASGARNI